MYLRLRKTLWVCLILNLALTPWLVVGALAFPFGIEYGEAPLADQAARLLAGQTLYKADLNEPPFVITNYGPVYPAAIAATARLTGLPLLNAGRLVSVLACLVTGLIIGLFCARLAGGRFAGVLGATLFLGNPLVIYWSSLARVDLLALCLSLTALYVLFRRWYSWCWLAVAVILLTAAVFTRQTMLLAVPLTGVVWLWRNDRRRSLTFIVALALACLAVFGLLNLITGGGLYLHTVVANANYYSLARLGYMNGRLLVVWLFGIVAVGLTLWQALNAHKRNIAAGTNQFETPTFLWWGLCVYLVGAFASALTVGKVGSNVNYLLEPAAALALWAGVSPSWQDDRKKWRSLAVIALLLCQVVWTAAANTSLYGSAIVERWRQLAEYRALFAKVVEATPQGTVLADDKMDMVVLAGQRIYFQPFEYTQLYEARLWDPGSLVADVERGRFPMIITVAPGTGLNEARWPPPVMAAIQANYEATGRMDRFVIYQPRVDRVQP